VTRRVCFSVYGKQRVAIGETPLLADAILTFRPNGYGIFSNSSDIDGDTPQPKQGNDPFSHQIRILADAGIPRDATHLPCG
jgi:hypothetical protein